MTDTFMLPEALRAQQWEIAKGHLRATVSLQGGYQAGGIHAERFTLCVNMVEKFIRDFEDEGMDE